MKIIEHPSPVKKSRGGRSPLVLLVHATAGHLEGDLATLCDPSLQPPRSCHYLIAKNGDVYRLVAEEDQAYHAGVSTWNGLEVLNERTGNLSLNPVSIGIELENLNDGKDSYTPEQVAVLIALTNRTCARWGIKRENVVRHLDVAPGRKTDPMGFPWEDFKEAIA